MPIVRKDLATGIKVYQWPDLTNKDKSLQGDKAKSQVAKVTRERLKKRA